MNPLPILRALAHGLADWLRLLIKLAPWSALAMGLIVLISQLGIRGYEQLTLSMALPGLIAKFVLLIFLFGVLAGMIAATSLPLRRADHLFYVSGAQRQRVVSMGQAFSCAVLTGVLCGGAAAIIWVAIVGGAHRLADLFGLKAPDSPDPALLLHPLSAPGSYLLIAAIVGILLVPLFLRLQLLPAAAAIEEDRARGAWALLMSTTRSKGPSLLAVAAVQAAVVLGAVITIKMALAAVPTSRIYLQDLPLSTVMVLIVIGGLWLSLLTTLQVVAVRHFIGLPVIGEDISAQHFEVENPDMERFVPPDRPTHDIGEFEAREEDESPESKPSDGLQSIPESAIGQAPAASSTPFPVTAPTSERDPGPLPPPPEGLGAPSSAPAESEPSHDPLSSLKKLRDRDQ